MQHLFYKRKGLQIFNLLAIFLVLFINYLANSLPIAGKTTGEVSALYSNLFTPAGFTFSIWGLIYILLLGFGFYQLRQIRSKSTPREVDKIGFWFIATCLLNICWLLAWHYQYIGLSVIIMTGLLVTLTIVYIKAKSMSTDSFWDRIWIKAPFSVYLGWISVATIANFSAYFVSIQGLLPQPLPPYQWAIAMLVVGGALALFFS